MRLVKLSGLPQATKNETVKALSFKRLLGQKRGLV